MSSRDRLVDLEVTLVHETPKAYLFDFELAEEVWIPKAACEYDHTDGTVAMKESYAIRKGVL